MTRPTRWVLTGLCAFALHALPAHAAEPLAVELESTAASLSEGDIRLAIEKELGKPVGGPRPGAPSDVTIGIRDQQIVVRMRQSTSVVERSVPLPSNPSDVPLTVSLIVGNLARDQSVGLAPASPPPEAAPPPAESEKRDTTSGPVSAAEPAPPPPSYRTHWFGIHAAQDFAFVGGENVCNSDVGQKTDNYACFYSGTSDRPFVHATYPLNDEIANGVAVATTRLLVSYEAAPTPWFSMGLRAGYAFRGGPPAGQQVQRQGDGSTLPFAPGSGGTPFLPAHLELTFRGWFMPLTERFLRGYVQVSGGMAQVDAKSEIDETDCAEHAFFGYANNTPDLATAFEECHSATGEFDPNLAPITKVDAWKKMGQGFVSLGAGSMVMVTERLGVVLNINVMYMLPASGLVLEPSLGMTLGL